MRLSRLLAFLALVAAAAGCNDTVAPTLDTGRPYTMWGVLNPTTNLQGIRVVPIGLVLDESGATPPIDGVVASLDVETGARVVWRDSLVRFASGREGHVYVANFRPRYDALYEVTATRSDGAVTSVRVRTPPAVEPIALAIDGNTATLPLLWTQAPSLNAVHVTYAYQTTACQFGELTVDAAPAPYPFEYGWRHDVSLTNALRDIRAFIYAEQGGNPAPPVVLINVRAEGFVSNTEWRPVFGQPYDPEFLVEPGTVENVQNGFGFVGGGFNSSLLWRPDMSVSPGGGFTTQAAIGCEP